MPTEQEDRENYIKVYSALPLQQIRDDLKSSRSKLGAHLTEHKDCSDNCPTRRNLQNEIGIINAVINLKQRQPPLLP